MQHKKGEELSVILSVEHTLLEAMTDWDMKMKVLMGKDFKNVLNEKLLDEEND